MTPITGNLLGATGSASAPSYTFSSSKTDGLYLAGTHQVGLATNGTNSVLFNSDQSVTWAGNQSFGGTTTTTGAATFNGAVSHASTTTLTGAVTLNATSYTFGAGAATGFWAGLGSATSVQGGFNGGGAAISTNTLLNIEVPFPCTITRWTIVADQSTTSTIQVYRANAALPTSGGTITGGSPPSISAATYATSTSLGAWTTTLAARDIIQFLVSANNNAQVLLCSLTVTRTG